MKHAATEAGTTSPPGTSHARTFWLLNIMELIERLAYYTIAVVVPLYVMQADDPGGLHLTAANKATVLLWWTAVSSLLPTVTGGFADRYGYKPMLLASVVLMTGAYVFIALMRDVRGFEGILWNYRFYFTGAMMLAIGSALFKPSLQGLVAHTLARERSKTGWSTFYTVVSLGGLLGYFMPAIFLPAVHTKEAWRNLFLVSGAFSSLNLLMLLTFADIPSGVERRGSPWSVTLRTLTSLLDARLLLWLLIMSGFWMMMYQLLDLMPNFIPDWVDTGPLLDRLGFLPAAVLEKLTVATPRGPQVSQNIILSVHTLLIVLFAAVVGYHVRRLRTLTAMFLGMPICIAGVLIAGFGHGVWVVLAGLACFAVGETLTGPKKNEYLARIAPVGKVGLYLGYVNIPIGVGRMIGSWLSGYLYGHHGEKATLALRYLAEHTPLGGGLAWDGDATRLPELLHITRPEAMSRLTSQLNLSHAEATALLWDTYHPQYLTWLPFAAAGLVCAVALGLFGRAARRWQDMDA